MIRLVLLFLIIAIPFSSSFSQNKSFWEFKTNGRIYSSPLVDQEYIYFGSGDNYFYALDKKDGKLKWKFRSAGPIYSSPAIYNEIVYFSSDDGILYALDKNTGLQKFSFKSGGEKQYDLWDYYRSSPIIVNKTLYWACGDSNVYAIDAKTGTLKWSFKTEGIVHASPTYFNGNIYIGGFDGYFYAINALNGGLIWKFNTIGDTYFPKGEIQKAAMINDSIVYFGTRDFNIYALNAKTGNGMWNMKELHGWIIATPFEYKGNLYYGLSDGHKFYCQDKKTGFMKWEKSLNMRVYGSAAVHNGIVYFGCFNGQVYGVDYQTGDTKWLFKTAASEKNYYSVYNEKDEFRADFELYGKDYLKSEEKIHSLGSVLCTPVIDNGIIYFGNSDGKFYAVSIN